MTPVITKDLINSIPSGIAIFRLDADGYHPVFINDEIIAKVSLSQYEIADAFVSDLSRLVHPDDIDKLSLVLYKGSVAGGRFSDTLRMKLSNDKYSWVEMHLNSVPGDDGFFMFFFSFNDVDDKVEYELHLEHTYEELLGIMNNTPGGIIVFDTKSDREPVPVYISSGIDRMLHGDSESVHALMSEGFYSLLHPEDRDNVIRVMEDAIRNLSFFQFTIRILSVTGAYVWADANGTVENLSGRRRIYVSFSDSSADKKSQQLLRHIVDVFVRKQYDCICLINASDSSYRILSTNPQYVYTLPVSGKDYDAEMLSAVKQYVISDDRSSLQHDLRLDNICKALDTKSDLDFFFTTRRKDGQLHNKKISICWIDKTNLQLAMVMSDQTESHRQQMEHQNTLVNALNAAEQANIAKSVFLSRMSHDIRTPLNAIMGFTEMGLDDPSTTPAAADRLQKTADASKYLLSLVNDVLDMSRIESGKVVLKNEPFNMTVLIDSICSIIDAQCKNADLIYRCSVTENVRQSYIGDILKIQQILVNLLGNSVKFTDPGGHISLSVNEYVSYESCAIVRFTVSDTGIGISDEFLPHIFETFTQENYGGTVQSGTGLGLAICRNLITLMNGNIDVRSEKGKGTVFTVDVQLGISEASALPRAAALPSIPPAEKEYDFSGRTVLLAEDNTMNQEIACYLLKNVGFDIDIASNGQEACELFASSSKGHYSAVILDIRMPVMNGIQAAGKIRAMDRPDVSRIPIIAMSADAFDEDISKSLSNGINAHLIKPINKDILYETLFELIR